MCSRSKETRGPNQGSAAYRPGTGFGLMGESWTRLRPGLAHLLARPLRIALTQNCASLVPADFGLCNPVVAMLQFVGLRCESEIVSSVIMAFPYFPVAL